MFGKYHDIKIILPADLLETYRKFGNSALSIADRIFTNETSENEVNLYADPGFAGDMLDDIGSGMNLSDYDNHEIPEIAKHCFDNVILEEPGNGNIFVA